MLNEKTFNPARRNRSNSFSPVLNGVLQRKCACGGSLRTGQCAECSKKHGTSLQRSAIGNQQEIGVPPIVHEVLRSPGQPLDGETRAFFEPRFGHDFSRVRIHMGPEAAASAKAIGAAAYTVGSDIVFGDGRYAPKSGAGRFLLAHELTHVVQQIPVLSRQPAAPSRGGAAPKTQGNASDRLAKLASIVESYANRADSRLSTLGSGSDVDAIRRNIGTARMGVTGLRQLAGKRNERVSEAVLVNFTPERLKAASDRLVLARVPSPMVAVSEASVPTLAAKSLRVSQPHDSTEMEADRIAAEIMSGHPLSTYTAHAEPSVYRLMDGATEAAFEEKLAEVAEVTAPAEVATEAVGPEVAEGGATLLGIGPVGWIVIAAAVTVVAVVAVGHYYYSKEDEAKKPAPAPAPAPTSAPAPVSSPEAVSEAGPETVPRDCVDTANRISNDKCKMAATAAHAGGDPVADLFCEQVTGDPCEYRAYAASGTAFFDAVRGRDAYECKCGLLSLVKAAGRGERWAVEALHGPKGKLEQIRRHLRVVKDCGLQYRLIVSNNIVADWFRSELGDEVDVGVEKSEFCD